MEKSTKLHGNFATGIHYISAETAIKKHLQRKNTEKQKQNIRGLMMQLITCDGIRQKQGRLRLIESQKFQVACGEKAKMSEMSPISELIF